MSGVFWVQAAIAAPRICGINKLTSISTSSQYGCYFNKIQAYCVIKGAINNAENKLSATKKSHLN